MEDKFLTSLRPIIDGIQNDALHSPEEIFQHRVLRPLLKLHNDRLVSLFAHYIRQRKQQWDKLTPKAQAAYIEHAIKTDQRLQERYMGVIMGWLTHREFDEYVTMDKEINRRMRTLLIQRLQDQMIQKK